MPASEVSADRILADLKELVAFPSLSSTKVQNKVLDYLASRVSQGIGFEVEMQEMDDGLHNLICRKGEGERTLLWNGHVDVVDVQNQPWTVPPFELTLRDGRAYGRGVADMKGAIASVLEAMRVTKDDDLRGQLVVTFVVEEEVDGSGTERLVETGKLSPTYVLVGEPTSLRPCVAQKGTWRFTVEVFGKAAHSGRPQGGVNAISGMVRVCQQLEALNDSLQQKTHCLLSPPTLTPTMVQGGVALNVVPDWCSISFDRRLNPGETVEEAREQVQARLAELSDVRWSIKNVSYADAMEMSVEDEFVQKVMSVLYSTLGHPVEAVGFNAGSDGHFFVNRLQVPTVVLGPGDLEQQAHRADESVSVAELVDAAIIYTRLIRSLLGAN